MLVLGSWRKRGACQVLVFNGCLSCTVHVSALRCHGIPRIEALVEVIVEIDVPCMLVRNVKGLSQGGSRVP